MSDAARRTGGIGFAHAGPSRRPDLFGPVLVFTVIVSTMLAIILGPLAAITFLLAGAALCLRSVADSIMALRLAWPWFAFAAFALASTTWSAYPALTLRGAVQLILTLIVGCAVAANIDRRRFVVVLALALLFTLGLGIARGATHSIGGGDQTSLIGIFASKNILGQTAGLACIVATSLFLGREFGWRARGMGGLLLAVSAYVLVAARSYGAIAATGVTLGVTAGALLISRSAMPAHLKLIIVVIGALCAVNSALLYFYFEDQLLAMIGKDPTLTGRTYLWKTGYVVMQERLFTGQGFQAFWVSGNAGAESLWRSFHLPSGAGFSFHNVYLNTAVDLGLLGGACALAIVVALGCKAVALVFSVMSASATALFGIVVFLLFRTFIETEFFDQFTAAQILAVAIWIYLTPTPDPVN